MNASKTAHLCLVSDQVTPNITPVLDATTRPELCLLLVSDSMTDAANNLATVLRESAQVEVRQLSLGDPWNIHACQDAVLNCLSQYEDWNIALNVTGGTKPMSIAAYEVFRSENRPIFYVHPNTDELIWMYPNERGSYALANRISLHHFLSAHGITLTEKGDVQVPPGHLHIAEELIRNIDYYRQPLALLNYYAANARGKRYVILESQHQQLDSLRQLINDLKAEKLVDYEQGKLQFYSESARFFANGGWLENYVFRVVASLKAAGQSNIQDVAQSVVTQRKNGVKNESDVMLLAENRLYLIECKTRNYKARSGTTHQAAAAADALYKLDSLAETLGGLKASGMLVSYLPLSPADLKRAASLNINVVQSNQLRELGNTIQRWILAS